MKLIEKQTDIGLLIFRVLVAGLLMFHGFGNLLGNYAFIKSMFAQWHIPEFFSYGAFIGEIVAPLLLIVGYKVRFASLGIALTMLVAIFTTHLNDIFSLNQFNGWAIELQAFYLFGAIAIFFTGGGKYVLTAK
ncbi:DoxX family protein [uncultured Kordia sp.]|uniref:DoxX family protein n=1 Tax=uncultured Kordia sp. TaxID=507699 RepID=UPI00260AF542|nr:DoxX family protein [uncultured Kordia sp.]